MRVQAPPPREPEAPPGPATVVDMGAPLSIQQQTVADAMITVPKTLDVDVSVADARRALDDTHVHMLLLARDGVLHGTLVRDDLRPDLDPRRPAVSLAVLAGRTISPDVPLDDAVRLLDRSLSRRLAVTDPTGALLGLLCLNRSRKRFCTEADVHARAEDVRGGAAQGLDPGHPVGRGRPEGHEAQWDT